MNLLTYLFNYIIIKVYQTKQTKMAKTRTLTATFENGAEVTRKTARTYTHVVKGYCKGFYPDEPNKERCCFEAWCGRPDLMQKQVEQAKRQGMKRILIAEVNDPWAE